MSSETRMQNIIKSGKNKKKKMGIEDFINMDCRLPENMAKLKRAVNKTKWFERFDFEEITPSTIEEGYLKVEKKYGVRVAYIHKVSELSWGIMIKDAEHKWVETVYCNTLFEGMCKVILVLYGYLIKGMKFKTDEKFGGK